MLILNAIPPPALVMTCTTPPQAKVLVTAKVDPWSLNSAVDMAMLEHMAQPNGRGVQPAPYGFYTGAVAYAIIAVNADRRSCREPVTIQIAMRLTDRRIGVAREKVLVPCQLAAITAHYRRHAEADEAVFRSYVAKVTATLTEGRVLALLAATDTEPGHLPERVNGVIEPVLADMDAARAAVPETVDTFSEMKAIEGTCA